MRIIGAIAGGLALSIGLHGVAWACSCLTLGPPTEAAAGADRVFYGRVTRVGQTSRGCLGRREPAPENALPVTLRVVEGFAGAQEGQEIEVTTPSSSAACGVDFDVGETWLVYAEEGTVSLCSRTREVSVQDPELVELARWAADR